MRRRYLAPAFVTTIATLTSGTACKKTTRTNNPPPPEPSVIANPPPLPEPTTKKRKRTAPASYAWNNPKNLRPTAATSLNPRDAKNREVFVSADDTCVVHVERDDPKQPLPPGAAWWKSERVDCPPAMDDPAWDHCTDQLVVSADGTCFCDPMGGHPPPPPRLVDCPAPAKKTVP